jgi:hypothetical protein
MKLRSFVTLALVAAAAAGAWLWITPDRAVDRLREAARAGDVETLDEVVDFESVRANLKADLNEVVTRRTRGSDGLLATIGAAVGGAVVGGLVDTFVSPNGVAAIAQGRRPDADNGQPIEDAEPRIDRRSLSTFVARFEGDGGNPEDRVGLEFSRAGLQWRLTRVLLPTLENEPSDGGHP